MSGIAVLVISGPDHGQVLHFEDEKQIPSRHAVSGGDPKKDALFQRFLYQRFVLKLDDFRGNFYIPADTDPNESAAFVLTALFEILTAQHPLGDNMAVGVSLRQTPEPENRFKVQGFAHVHRVYPSGLIANRPTDTFRSETLITDSTLIRQTANEAISAALSKFVTKAVSSMEKQGWRSS